MFSAGGAEPDGASSTRSGCYRFPARTTAIEVETAILEFAAVSNYSINTVVRCPKLTHYNLPDSGEELITRIAGTCPNGTGVTR